MTNAISMAGLTKHYKGVDALTDLTIDVPAGTVYGFLGPNGAGKTTAMKVIAGLARATAGGATVNGVPVSPAGTHRRHLGYLAQDPRFYGWMTGRETLRYVARFRGSDADREQRISTLLERVGLADAGDRRTSTYSGGHAPATRHRSGPGRPPGRHPPRRTGLGARPDRPQGRARAHAGAQGRDDRLLLDPHPRRRPAGQRPRRDPRPRSPGEGGPHARPSRIVHQEHAPGRPWRSIAGDRGRASRARRRRHRDPCLPRG